MKLIMSFARLEAVAATERAAVVAMLGERRATTFSRAVFPIVGSKPYPPRITDSAVWPVASLPYLSRFR